MSRIFISYSHRGRGPEWKAVLLEQLKVFTSQNLIEAWDDEKIPGGWRWEKEIENAIHDARLAVILLTNEALESEFILEHELKPLQAREKDGIIVIPVNCGCAAKEYENHEWIKKLQIRPFEAKPLSAITDPAELKRVLRHLATEIAEELGHAAFAQIPSTVQAPDEVREYLDKFPLTRGPGLREERLIGREYELALLDIAFASSFSPSPPSGKRAEVRGQTAIVSLVAWGGVGKTMLVQHWLQRLQREGWFGARRVYAWSFYSQGTKEDRQASEDTFLAHALEWFGVQCEPTLSPWDKGRLLADTVARERTLLILDGIEPLQYPPGPMGGQLRAPGVQSLLKQLARKSSALNPQPSTLNQSLCLVTTREPLTDLADFQRHEGSPWGSVLRVDLGNLTDEAGAALLHHAGANRAGAAEIKPDDTELLAAGRQVDGHALTLNLLGRFLGRAHGGDIRRRDLVKFEEADRKEQGGTTFKMLATFENWFAKSGEFGARQLAILRMLGLFDRPADGCCMAALYHQPAIPKLTDALFNSAVRLLGWRFRLSRISDEDWKNAVSFLANLGLIQAITSETKRQKGYSEQHATTWLLYAKWANPQPLGEPEEFKPQISSSLTCKFSTSLDTHPLLREYFACQLRQNRPKSYRLGHKRLFEYSRDATPFWPEGLDGLQILYEAIYHGCQAGLHKQCREEIYSDRISRSKGKYPLSKLGAFSLDLQALSCFFRESWKPETVFDENDQAWLLNHASFRLAAVGRLCEAHELMLKALEMRTRQKDWPNASRNAQNSSAPS